MKHGFFARERGRNDPSQNDLPMAFISPLKKFDADTSLLRANYRTVKSYYEKFFRCG